jgi:hypothetical protein
MDGSSPRTDIPRHPLTEDTIDQAGRLAALSRRSIHCIDQGFARTEWRFKTHCVEA